MFSNALKSFSSNITSNYTLSPSPTSHSGPWKIYDAKKKKTNQSVSVFVFERKTLESSGSSTSLSLRGSSSKDGLKAAQDEVVERLKKEASLLARLRHPCVLELVEPVEETRGGLMFATEQVTSSLAVLLQEKDEEESRGGSGGYAREYERGVRKRREVEIDELEIQKGLLQIGKGLEFLHESASLVHGNLTPEAIMVNAKSDWKLFSLGFTVTSVKPPLPPPHDPRLPSSVQLSLDYASPELILDQTLTPSTDMFSLGLLIVALYSQPHRSPLETHNSASVYRRMLSSPSTTPNGSNGYLSKCPLPRQLTDSVLPKLLTRRPAGRLTAREFQQSEYFDNILVSTLRFLDSFPAKTPSEKSAFMRGLPKVIPQFPRSVLEKKILPGLVEELRDGSMLALVLPNIFSIIEPGSSRLFSEKVLGRLKEVFIFPGSTTATASSEPKTAAAKVAEREREAGKEGGLTVILSNLAVIREKTTSREFKDDILPLYHLALESPTHALQDLALRNLAIILPKLDFPTLKGELFPVVSSVFTKTSSLGIKIRGLEAFKVLCGGVGDDNRDGLDGFAGNGKKEDCPVLDKYTIQEKVVPLLKGIKTKEPAVMIAALNVFDEIGKVCDREIIAAEILPILWGMSLGPLLGLEQFQAFMHTIKFLSTKIEQEQTRKLQELSLSDSGALNSGSRAGDFLSFGGAPGAGAMNGNSAPGESEFENLVFGHKIGANKNTVTDGFDTGGWGATVSSPPAEPKKTSAPAFSWSTPSPTISSTPSQPGTRMGTSALTPQQQRNPTSSPTPNGVMGLGMNLQPMQPGVGFGSMTAMRPQRTPSPAKTGTEIDWTIATSSKPSFVTSSTSTSNAWSTTTTTNRPTPTPATNKLANLSFSSPTINNTSSNPTSLSSSSFKPFPAPSEPPGGSKQSEYPHPTILFGQTRLQPPPPITSTGAFAGFSIPPPPGAKPITISSPPAGMGMGMGMGMAQQQQQQQPKKGLDAWESLL